MKIIMYSYETRMRAIEMKIEAYSVKQLLEELGIKNKTQIKLGADGMKK